MQSLKIWEDKIKEKRKSTPWREFLKEFASFRPLNFYKNTGYISIYPPKKNIIGGIIPHNYFYEIRDIFTNFGVNYNFNKNFFTNFKNLFLNIHLPPTFVFGESENSEYSDQIIGIKNCYLSFVVIKGCENIFYSFSVKENSSNVYNSIMVWDNCDNIYFSKGIIKSYNIFYSKHITNSANIWFSSNLIGCSECLLCNNLENQSFCIKNKKLSKEEYFNEKKLIIKDKNKFLSIYKGLNNFGNNNGSNETNGIFNIQCNNVINGLNNYQVNNGRNVMFIGGKDLGKNIYDSFLNTPPEKDIYGLVAGGFCDNIYNTYQISGGSNIYYSYFLENCSFCLGCIGLKNKSFCILNKQYSKEEWYELADKIFASMEKDGILGDFFPGSLNPFYFNDTMAYLIDDSFTKEEVEKKGFMWRDEKIKVDIPEGAEIVYSTPPQLMGSKGRVLSDYQGFDENGNWKINPEILKKVIVDNDGNYYRIIKQEYDFLMKYELPLPEIHWLERIKMGFKI